jgi:hypothetical protein
MKLDPTSEKGMGFCFMGTSKGLQGESNGIITEKGGKIMPSMKTMIVVLTIALFALLPVFQLAHAEIYKWVDEKGTIHFTEDPATIPEEYRDQVQTKAFEESPPTTPLKRDLIRARQKQAPERSQQEKEPQFSPPLLTYDLTNDPEYQQMIKRLNQSIYYQRDIYQPGTQRIRHRAGELIPGGSDAAQSLKEKLDRLVSNPEFSRDTQYRKDVMNFFDSHFYDRDIYFPRTQSIMHSRGEIKITSTEYDLRDTRDIQKGNFQTGSTPEGLIQTKGGAIDTRTGEFYPGAKGGIISPRTGEFMPDVGGGYIDPKTGRFIPKQ